MRDEKRTANRRERRSEKLDAKDEKTKGRKGGKGDTVYDNLQRSRKIQRSLSVLGTSIDIRRLESCCYPTVILAIWNGFRLV